jgi:hypothetical protein
VKIDFHPEVQRDVSRILRFYDGINDRLGDEFWEELNAVIDAVGANPQRFHYVHSKRRRANLKRFPYHFLSVKFLTEFVSPLCGITDKTPNTARDDFKVFHPTLVSDTNAKTKTPRASPQ